MKRALVTGASGEIGREIAILLADKGYEIIVHANKSIDKANTIVEQIVSKGGNAFSICCDVRDENKCKDILAPLTEQKTIQIIVNNAGMHDDTLFAAMEKNQWQNVIDVNLNGFYNITQPLMLPMLRSRWGRIVNISSISGIMGNAGQVNYSAAKAGLHGASKALAREVAGRGVTVNVVAPGIIDTELTRRVFTEDQIKNLVPMKRAGTPRDVAAIVEFLTSEDAGYISGQVIAVSGAMI